MTGWSGCEVMLNLFQHLYGELFLLQILKQVQDDMLLRIKDDKLLRIQDEGDTCKYSDFDRLNHRIIQQAG